MLAENEDEEEEVPVKKKTKSQLNKEATANDRRDTHITIYLSNYKNNSWVYFRL